MGNPRPANERPPLLRSVAACACILAAPARAARDVVGLEGNRHCASSGVPRALPAPAPVPQAPVGSPSAQSGRIAARRHRRRSGQPGATSALRPVFERMARAGLSRRSLLHPQLAAIGLCLSRCMHLLVTGRPLPVPGTGHARKSEVGGAQPPWPPPPRRSQRTRRRPSVAPAPPSIMQPAAGCRRARMCCATLAPNPLPPPPSRLAQVGEGASSSSQPGGSSPSPPGGVATPYRVFFPSFGWVHIFTLM